MSMEKYWSIVWKMIEDADVVLEVIDARFPSICRSNRLEQIIMEKDNCNLLIAINKADLVPREHVNGWIKWLAEHEGIHALGVSATKRLGTSILHREIHMASKKKTANVAVVGLPNTGKSSIINRLKGKKSASTAPIAGHTKGQQMVRISKSMLMYDTPGIIPVRLPMKHQFLMGLIPITKLKDPLGAAEALIRQFNEIMPDKIYEHYDIPADLTMVFENLAIKHNKIMKGGVPDERAAAIVLLRDHNRGDLPIWENVNDPLRLHSDT